jgi:hypothetical protein
MKYVKNKIIKKLIESKKEFLTYLLLSIRYRYISKVKKKKLNFIYECNIKNKK